VQALALQRIGWRRLTSHPLSRVKLPADDEAPAAVSRIEAEATSEAVTLRWDEVQDAGTGVFRYIIRRSDGAEFDNVIARYRDTTVQPGRSYTYSVAGEDFAGNRSKAAKAAVDVPVDREAASIVKVRADQNAQTIRVVFDEPVDPTSATTVEHWRVKGLAVKAARLADADTVVLTTSPMKAGASYAIEVSGIADRAAEPNVTGSISTQFVFTPPRWKKFDLTDWDDTAVEIEGPQIRITAKGEGKFRSWGKMDRPAIAGAYRTVSGDFDLPLAITSQGQVAATLELKPYQRKGKVKTGIIVAEDIENIQAGNFAVFYLDDSTRFRLTVHRDWLVTARVIGAGLRHGDPRKNRQGLNLPVWIRLVREGTNLTAYYSLTGTGAADWTKLGTIDARKMPEKVELGVFQTSGVADEHSTAMLDLRATGEEKSYTSVDN
jgi:hypothetical protein